eukprot:Gregarina_sp_Pseudo_9__1644@NODE_2105_length_1148_cov_30_562669_g1943_i0_p1_GENE_NODE_2105_length_1148_cov_30_562669_g1943_i0NODE_2105_length_1148_cov_30_562669_g1943_i0_p1_ORF_typecomplete_len337_score29_97_NODE_2105_length_1148_cov_30_562669_g1943_i01021112
MNSVEIAAASADAVNDHTNTALANVPPLPVRSASFVSGAGSNISVAEKCFPVPSSDLTHPVGAEKWIVSVEGWKALWFGQEESPACNEVMAKQLEASPVLAKVFEDPAWKALGESTRGPVKKQGFKQAFNWSCFSRFLRSYVATRLGTKEALWLLRGTETRNTITRKGGRMVDDMRIVDWHDCARWQGCNESTEDYLYALRFLCYYRRGERQDCPSEIAVLLFKRGLYNEDEYGFFKASNPSDFKNCLSLVQDTQFAAAAIQSTKRARRSGGSTPRSDTTKSSSRSSARASKRSKQDCEACFISHLRALRNNINIRVMHHQGVYPERLMELSVHNN